MLQVFTATGGLPHLAQLNFQLPDDLLARIDAAKPEYLDRKGFLCLLIDQALDTPCTLGIASGSEAITSKAVTSTKEKLTIEEQPLIKDARTKKPKDSYASRAVSPELVPADLLDCQQLLPEWWAVKKGVRSEGVWNRVCGKLRGWTPEDRRKALEAAIASGWGDVFEPKPNTPAQARGVQPRKSLMEQAREAGMIP